jgi:hypothetical protein
MHSHVVNTNVAALSTDPPGAELIFTHDDPDIKGHKHHFLIMGVDGNLKVENEVAEGLRRIGYEVIDL